MSMTLVAGHLAATASGTLATFQANDSINSGNSKLLMVFIGIAAVALLIQALVLAGAAMAALKAAKELRAELSDFRTKAAAFIDKANSLTVELTPQVREITAKVNTITTHVEKIAGVMQQKVEEFAPTLSAANQTVLAANQTVADANQKTRVQVQRVNGMVSSALDATARFGSAIERTITAPGREIAGIVSGVKAGLDSLVHSARSIASGNRSGSSPSRAYSAPQPRPVSPYRPGPISPAYFRPTGKDSDA